MGDVIYFIAANIYRIKVHALWDKHSLLLFVTHLTFVLTIDYTSYIV